MFPLVQTLTEAVRAGASDVHFKLRQPPFTRVRGELAATTCQPLTAESLKDILDQILPPHMQATFQSLHEADFSYEIAGVARFRVNAFVAQGIPTLAMRHVKTLIPTIDELNLPAQLKKIAASSQGIIIVSGATGSGKSSTLAAMINEINQSERSRIITIEDPIEYFFADKQSLITQREVGMDTGSFQVALVHVMRQDPDVIMIGEMRDEPSFRTAITAAETGHGVLTTLHSSTAASAINRILQFFPPSEWMQLRMTLANTLRAVVCQRLLRGAQGGMVPAVEIMINTPTVRKLIEQDKLEVLPAAIETGVEDGMQTFNQAIYQLIKSGMVTQEEGMQYATNPGQLSMNLKGIFLDEARRILST
ncbi:MAG: PilT/PilU family type 4a pilus ATPase [bacterium]